MRVLLFSLAFLACLNIFHSAPGRVPPAVTTETLSRETLSLEGVKLVDEEVLRALYGVKQIKEVMASNEMTHEQLIKTLHNSREKKKEVSVMAQHVVKKLDEAEQECKDTLKTLWDECQPCLQDACKNFYNSTCRRGFAKFSSKLEGFFHRVSTHFGLINTEDAFTINKSTEMPDLQLKRIEDSFNDLVSKVDTLVTRSTALVFRFHSKMDETLQQAFTPELQEDKEMKALDSDFLHGLGVGLKDMLESFVDFTSSVLEEFETVITQAFDDLHGVMEEAEKEQEKQLLPGFLYSKTLCRDLRRQSAECWQLQSKCQACQGPFFSECPSMRELHIELNEVSELLDIAKEQYDEVLGIVERHTVDTISWINNMAAEFGWVVELADGSIMDQNIFNITTVENEEVVNIQGEQIKAPMADTKVEVNILNAPPLTLTVPGNLQPQDPAFIQYIANEALGFYKQKMRPEDA
ncbi:clusterin-like protein 1 isoform X2 [Tachysurus vachellii]|uniref:clusterin-like protein 1 isoform X2 n=2 Tax=Tachysurus vachellii TaxID=175792 RepID=UPI00296AFB22|nr:clusterin-like protein 1 isoform X2 [Tachysurus vachellii]